MVEACQITAHSLTSNQSYSIYGSYSLFTAGKKAARSSINSLEHEITKYYNNFLLLWVLWK